MLKRTLARVAHAFGYAVLDLRQWTGSDGLYSLHTPRFLADSRLRKAYARGVQASRHDPGLEWRVHAGLWAANLATRVPGDFVECGVNAGLFSSAILTWLDWSSLDRIFYLVDTFAGPPLDQYSPVEIAGGMAEAARRTVAAGGYVTDMDRIRANYREWPRVEIVQGAVPDVLPMVGAKEIAFLHIDMNCAAPEVAAFRCFWPRMPSGAVVLLDDYGYRAHTAQGDAFDALAREFGMRIACLPTGQGLIVK